MFPNFITNVEDFADYIDFRTSYNELARWNVKIWGNLVSSTSLFHQPGIQLSERNDFHFITFFSNPLKSNNTSTHNRKKNVKRTRRQKEWGSQRPFGLIKYVYNHKEGCALVVCIGIVTGQRPENGRKIFYLGQLTKTPCTKRGENQGWPEIIHAGKEFCLKMNSPKGFTFIFETICGN